MKKNKEFECPADCDNCEHNRSVSWCAQALPKHQEIDDAYKIHMEGFFEGLRAAEQEYQACIKTIEELDEDFVKGTYVEVVRCKNCAKNPKKAFFGCPMAGTDAWNENGYCWLAEKEVE